MSSFRRLLLWVCLVITGTLSGFAASRNVILITIDTARADRMGFLGSQQGLTPHLDAFAGESVTFIHAYSQAPLTTASHATILSGCYPQFHGVNDAGVPLPKTVPYGPAIFRAQGYQTAAFVGSVILDPKAGAAAGFDRGFGLYDAGFHSTQPGEDRYHSIERRGDDVVERAIRWVGRRPAGPFFLWVHVYDPHAPYDPPEPYKTKYAKDPYDGEIAYSDAVIGKLLDRIRAFHLFDGSVIALMSDHGEALGEHGERGHGIFLYDPTIHVPLVLKLPGQRMAGKRVDAMVELADVMPTLLQAAGINVPPMMQGHSLLSLASVDEAAHAGEASAYAETDYPQTEFGWSALRSLRKGKYLFIEAPRNELYDQHADPGEQHNLAKNSSAITGTLAAALMALRQRTTARVSGRSRLDPEQAQRLRALGYLTSSDRAESNPHAVAGTDPKDKIEIANSMTEANLDAEEGRYQQAAITLQKVIAMDSAFAPAYISLGAIYSSLGNFKDAIPALRKAVGLRPQSVSAHYQLGLALFQTAKLKDAAVEFEAAVARDPDSAVMHYSLASVYVRIDRMGDARKQLEESIKLKPNFFESNLMLGQVFVVQKKPTAAMPYLQKAARLQPNSREVHLQLSKAYAQLGQIQNAEREQRLAHP